jgi:hypothetical protein
MHSFTRSLVILLAFILRTDFAMAIEEPSYDQLVLEAPYEIRHYRPMLIAQVFVDGDMDQASNKGFRLIADFIFGNNIPNADRESGLSISASSVFADGSPTSSDKKPVKIEMTAPVTVEPQAVGDNIEMAKRWRVTFVMPSKYTLSTIPKPKNSAIELIEVPEKYYAVVSFSGFNTQAKVQSKMNELLNWTKDKGLKSVGPAQLSRYTPPWTLPMFRRNEILQEIAKP